MTDAVADPLAAVRNLAGKAFRRAAAVPKRGVRLVRRATRFGEQARAAQAEWQIEREIAQLARGRHSIIAGPWLSEVGFEVLYWIPFLRWFEDRFRVDRERVVAISRGGVADWYADVAGAYIEIFDHVSPGIFHARNAERRARDEGGGQKQTTRGPLDAELVGAAARRHTLHDPAVCHPSLMYRLFNEYWFGNRALDHVLSHTRHMPLAMPSPHGLRLPAQYVAAKFYTGMALPDTAECRAGLREIVRALALRLPVVLLETGISAEDHADYPFRDIPNVISVREQLTPQSNLGTQTSVIAGASGFVGTCGSLAWLAPMLGVDTIAVYADDRFLLSHIRFAEDAFHRMGAARFDTFDLRAAAELDLLADVTLR
jgi:hypothetical protein